MASVVVMPNSGSDLNVLGYAEKEKEIK